MAIRILFCDDYDNGALCKTLATHFDKRGFYTDYATSISQAITLLSECEFDVCVTDLSLDNGEGWYNSKHNLSGLDLIEYARDKALKTKFIVLSGGFKLPAKFNNLPYIFKDELNVGQLLNMVKRVVN